MADKRGLVASYPFIVQAPEAYQPRNEERFRAQMAQVNADILDRLTNLETDVDAVETAVAAIPPPPVVPAFADAAEALAGISPDTIISPETLKVVTDTIADPPPFASTAEARAGVVTDKVMSPALVRALSGLILSPDLTGTPGHLFTGIPPEATEVDLSLIQIGMGAVSMVFTLNEITSGYSLVRMFGGATFSANLDFTNGIVIDNTVAGLSYSGTISLARNGVTGWYVKGGAIRRTGGPPSGMYQWAGGHHNISADGSLTQFRVAAGANLTAGRASLRWRI